MVAKVYFLDVPVYRLDEEAYYRQMNEYIDNGSYPGLPEDNEAVRRMFRAHPGKEEFHRQHLRERFGGSWRYNEIIGYLRLHFLGAQIRGEWWRVASKRIVKTRRKMIEYQTWNLAPEIEVEDEATNEDIYALIRQYIADCSKLLGKKYIDDSMLTNIGLHVDWRQVMRRDV